MLPDFPKPVNQHVPLPEYEANLRYFLDQLTSPDSPYAAAHTPGLNIVLITPPPLYIPMMGDIPWAKERVPSTTKEYVDAVKRVGEEYAAKATEGANWRVGVVDMWSAVLAAGGEGEGLRKYLRCVRRWAEGLCPSLRPGVESSGSADSSDGLHLTSEGYGVFWDEYARLVRTTFKGRGLDWEDEQDLPLRMPA